MSSWAQYKSEILYLNLPSILISSSGDFRSSEQEKNIDQACAFSSGRLQKFKIQENGKDLSELIKKAINAKDNGFRYVPGNEEAIDFILNYLS